jgi:hypothetical protein
MMKPNIEDVVDYVKAGEGDPEMQQTLDMHPDGPELLKQARFICRMLQEQLGTADGGAAVADMERSGGDLRQVLESRHESFGRAAQDTRTFYQSASLKRPSKKTSSTHDMLRRSHFEGVDLGTLEVEIDGEQATLSYQPVEGIVGQFNERLSLDFLAGQQKDDEIRIRGNSVDIFLPKSIRMGEVMKMRATAGLREIPNRGLEFIFMPEFGPFVRMTADDMGATGFLVPEESGTLRIESGLLHYLRIQIRK